jgi:hypothetical protein
MGGIDASRIPRWRGFNLQGPFPMPNRPHAVALAWMEDGTFGVLDSEREDVSCEDFKGHSLDREVLELLGASGEEMAWESHDCGPHSERASSWP